MPDYKKLVETIKDHCIEELNNYRKGFEFRVSNTAYAEGRCDALRAVLDLIDNYSVRDTDLKTLMQLSKKLNRPIDIKVHGTKEDIANNIVKVDLSLKVNEQGEINEQNGQ